MEKIHALLPGEATNFSWTRLLRFRSFLVLNLSALLALTASGAEPGGTGITGTNSGGKEPVRFSVNGGKPKLSPVMLWYDRPASQWVEALPIGNGRLGGMVFGGIEQERIQLNEDTVWAGSPYDPANPNALEAIKEGRRLIFEGKVAEAAKLLKEKDMGNPPRQMQYQPLADLNLTFPSTGEPVTEYVRTLELDTAVARTVFKRGGVTFTREVFSSAPDQVEVVHLTADKPGAIEFTAGLKTLLNNPQYRLEGGVLCLTSTTTDSRGIPGKVQTETRCAVINRGGSESVAPKGEQITVKGANEAVILVAAATNFKNWKDISGNPAARAAAYLAPALKKPFPKLLSDHVAEHQKLFNRVSIDLGTGPNSGLPTDERVRLFEKGGDPGLAALLFQFGRYLLIASSRPGTQPANLQGLWNDSLTPAWASKYTININAEMNYWPAETANLSECHLPLLKLVQELVEPGSRTAQVMYGAHGWVAHHNTDLWRATAPVDNNGAGIWPMGGAWLCTHLWEHYLFTGDKEFLKTAYPTMKGACEFFLDVLVEHPQYHWLVTCPSFSPEHGPFCAGPTMDMAILRDLFGQTEQAAQVLGIDTEFRERLVSTRAKLAPFQIGKFGQLQEWLEDIDQESDTHRHVSHLYALFPSSQISSKTPDLMKAARVTLNGRGDAGTGWSLAWKINFWARLLDGDRAFKILSNQLGVPGHLGKGFDTAGGTYPNLFDAHPPFQIDGNFGAVSGIVEMLLQSHTGEIALLPALPSAWPEGNVRGLRARGGFEVDETWKNGKLSRATVRSIYGTACTVVYNGMRAELKLKPGEAAILNGDLQPVKGL